MGQAALQITLVLLLAYLVWELARLAIDRQLRAENPGVQAMGDDAGRARRGSPPCCRRCA